MNWELVAQIVVITLVLLFAGIIWWAVVDVTRKNAHERNMELRQQEHDAEKGRVTVVQPGAIVISPDADHSEVVSKVLATIRGNEL